jgi:hypothetical protein
MANIGIGQQNLIDLIETRENSYKLFKYQMSQLTNEGKDLYIDYLKRNLTEEKIDKILQKFFSSHYTEKGIEPIVQLKKPFLKLEPLSNAEIHKSNEQFLKRKLSNLTQIFRDVNNIAISTNEILKQRNPKYLTFRYNYKSKDETLKCLTYLYDRLERKGFIESKNGNTIPKFKAIFKGTTEIIPVENRIIWNSNYYALKYFITQLVNKNIIEKDYHDRWRITTNCFTKKEVNLQKGTVKIIEITTSKMAGASVPCKEEDIKAIDNIIKQLISDLRINE